jgi:hypothetical protein
MPGFFVQIKYNKFLGRKQINEELTKNSTSGNFPQVRFEGNREVKRNVEFYNLDKIGARQEWHLRLHSGYIRNPFVSTIFKNIEAFDYMPIT